MNQKLHDKIRSLREIKNWSQEYMAEQVHMSKNGYAKVERGETRLTVDTLDKISQAFGMDMVEFINFTDKGMICLFSENNSGTHYGNFYQGTENLVAENEKLQLALKNKDVELSYKDELLNQKDNEISALKKLLAIYEKNG